MLLAAERMLPSIHVNELQIIILNNTSVVVCYHTTDEGVGGSPK
jgi:hypothetical protein